MTDTLELTIQSTIFDRKRKLKINPEFIEFDDADFISGMPTIFKKDEIVEWKLGVVPIAGYRFYIGRVYCIDIKNKSGRIIRIRMKSVYGIRK